MTAPTPDDIRAAYNSPSQRAGRAIVERQVQLNEIRVTLGLPVGTPHDQVLATITELRKGNRD